VTILTSGLERNELIAGKVNDQLFQMASHIAQTDSEVGEGQRGLLMKFDTQTQQWYWNDNGTTRFDVPDNYAGKSLVLDANINFNQQLFNNTNVAGWAEGVADNLFSALVKLDVRLGEQIGGYDLQGNLTRTKGKLFNSSLHFIGVGQGAIVNDEIVQRLGTYYPTVGKNGGTDLQMTTIDAPAAIQGSTIPNFTRDPEIKIWDNVTFADNYYQTITNGINQNTLVGRSINGADVNIDLSQYYQFGEDDNIGSPHLNALAWYVGTANLSGSKLNNQKIYRRAGDLSSNLNTTRPETWYTPTYGTASTFMLPPTHGAANAPWEGIGTGWFYSVLGGGISRRAAANGIRTDVKEDNTATAAPRQRGDFAVPTLFDGNFDAIFNQQNIQPIPGWSSTNQLNLVNGYTIGTLAEHWTKLGTDLTQANYDLRLTGGQTITHDSFVVPDWGALRFDLHTPSLSGGKVLVTLVATDGSGALASTWVDLQAAMGTPAEYQNDTHRIGYATKGFETFMLDIPESLRGRVAKLQFALDTGVAYLDNVFFKSQQLLLGSPRLAIAEPLDPNQINGYIRQEARSNPINFANNYLLEKPQYTASYSNLDHTPNWVAYELNKSWIGTAPRFQNFYQDETLPNGWIRVKNSDYAKPKSDLPDGFLLSPGHMSAAADNSRSLKDSLAVNLTTNILPQHEQNNNGPWKGLELYLRNKLVNEQGKELYIYAGGYGTKADKGTIDIPSSGGSSSYSIHVPSHVWKVVVIADKPGAAITAASDAFAVWMPNENIAGNSWQNYKISINELESLTNYDFLANLPNAVKAALKAKNPLFPDAALFADQSPTTSLLFNPLTISFSNESTIAHNSVANIGSVPLDSIQNSISEVTVNQYSIVQVGTSQISSTQVNIPQTGTGENSITQTGLPELNSSQASLKKEYPAQVGITQIDIFQSSLIQGNTTQISTTKIDSNEIKVSKVTVLQDDILQNNHFQGISPHSSVTEIPLPSSITLQQLFSSNLSHDDNTSLLTNVYSTAQSIWHTNTDLNLTFHITNLPTGQLAEATITGYDQLGRPNTATISIDDDANGVGWFVDSTAGDNSEFTGTDTYFQATSNSAASGKYDLLTAILHEMGHTLGFINGYSQFNQNIKGRQFYTDSTHSYALSSDLSHLDNTLYPNDLLNTNLKPGIRKLPSTMDWAIINTINSGVGSGVSGVGMVNPAHLTASALIGITNGDFTTPTTWNTLGATNIINGTATLTEQSQKLSELTQAFIIPTGAKTLQFTIKDNHLIPGDTTKAANDAFEVALLDTNTFNPLAGTSIGLNHTDSLLNIQANGTIHKSDKVTITALGNNSSIVTIDLTQVTPSTQATLYFNLLGFGARTTTVTIDDVKLFTDTQPIPITNNDTLTTTQNTPLTLTQLTTNDTNVNTIQIINQPTHGTLTQTPDGKFTYQPVSTYVGNDSFTYLGFGSDGQISNLATVNLTINNLPPKIETVTIPTTIKEGQNIQLSATATDGGSSTNLTYTWNLGDGTNPIAGRNIAHTYTDNGNYDVTLTVTDKDGGSTQQTTTVKVDNLAPIVNLTAPKTSLNQGESLNLGVTYSDPGIKDTHTITWNFSDGAAPVTGVTNPNHTFTKAGTNNVTVTVTDNDGASTTKSIQIAVTNVAPTITNLNIPTNINEGQSVTLTATATDPGNDTLIYNWYINGATTPVVGQTINYTFPDNGIYPVKLDVIDTDGAITTQSVNLTVNNVAPTIVSIVKPTTIKEGESVSFTANAIDPGINDALTYSWDFGDHTPAVTGQNVTHTFADNGNYNIVLTVTDKDGAATTQTVVAKVDNAAPVILSIVKPTTIKEGESVVFAATATDPGVLDTLTYSWNFGDNTNPVTGQNVTHTFADNGNYNVILTVTDKDGAATNQTVVAKVDNVAPTIVSISKPTTIKEGESVTFAATATDPGILDTLTYSWNFGDNTPVSSGQNVNHTFADNGNYNVVLTVTDKDGGVTTQTVVAKVDNVAPTIVSIVKPTTIKEGESVTFTATATDPGILDTLTYSWNFGDNTPVSIGQNVTHTFADNGNYNVTLTVTDKDGAAITQTVVAKVDNVAPTIVSIAKPTTIKEGESVAFSATVTDPGILDTLTYSWNFGDSTPAVNGRDVNHTFADNGNYNVVLTVTDKDGAATTQTVVAKVDNVAPTIVSIAKPTTIKEGESVAFSATVTDPGILDTLTYSWNFGDSTPAVNGRDVNHTFADNGNYNVVLTVTDKDGAATTQTVVAKVDNVAPTIVSIAKPTTIKEGESVAFSATVTDPGTLDTLTYSWNFGDNTPVSIGQNVNHTFADNGNYNIVLTVTDKDGGVTTQTVVAKVDNVAPTIVSIAKPTTIKEGESVAFSATATDPGTLDTLTYSWNFGDSTPVATGKNVNHTFADNGNYNIVLTVTDKDGGVTTQTVVAKVDNVAPTIVSIAKPTTIVQTQSATFTATATDPGILDTLTYTWNFGDNTPTASGQNAAHTFTNAGTYTLSLNVTDKDGATTTTTQQITVTALPTITINDPTITEGNSGTTNLTFTLTLSQASTQTVSVNYNTSNITALSGSDYTATSGTITFNAGETSKTITVAIVGDTTAEATETFALNLTTAINATIAKTQGTATILDNDTITAPTSGIRSGGTVSISGSANLDGNINSRADDTTIYAAKGVNLNGNVTLPVKRDANGNPLKDANGKTILETNEITIAPGGSTSSLSSKYSGITSATQTITIPTFTDTKQQDFLSKVPSTGVITFDLATNSIASAAAWNSKFPPAGTSTNPTVVRVINGNLNLPSGINLSNYIIIVENGNISLNNGNPALNNITFIANNGNIDLKSVTGISVSLCASGNVNFSGGNQLAGNWIVNSNGNTTFAGSNSMSNATSAVKIVAQGNININGSTSLKGQLWTKKNFSANGSTTIVGAITAQDNVDIQGNSTITG
jgi:large repetitive protein